MAKNEEATQMTSIREPVLMNEPFVELGHKDWFHLRLTLKLNYPSWVIEIKLPELDEKLTSVANEHNTMY